MVGYSDNQIRERQSSYVFDLLDGEVSTCWDAHHSWSDVHDDHYGFRDIALEQFIDLQV